MNKSKGLKTGGKIMVLTKPMADRFKREGIWDDDFMIVDKLVVDENAKKRNE